MLFFYYDGADLQYRVRLGSGFSFTEAAESGTLAMSRVRVDDPSGNLEIVGHRAFRAIETSCSFDSLFRGYFADRSVMRADSMLTGVARAWDGTVYDLNAALQFVVFRGTTAQRPAETDTARLAWALASAFTGPISSDTSNVFGAGVDLDKQDYRGQTLADVLSDCAQVSGCNYFVAWDGTLQAPVLHYYLPTRAYFTSTIKISNVLADVNGSTVFAPDKDAKLNKDPSRVYSGVYYQYGDRTSAAEYETNATVLSNIGHARETMVLDASIGAGAKAIAKADKYLSEAETELDVITCVLHKVPPSAVNLIRAGHRIQVKFSHFTGYTSYTYMRVQRRTISQDGDTQNFYQLELQLCNPKQGGTAVRHRPQRRPDADTSVGSSVSLTSRELATYFDGFDADPIATISYGNPVTKRIGSWVFHNIAYATCGCPLGAGGWSGAANYEGWWEYTTGALADNVVGIRFTIAAANTTFIYGNAGTRPYYYGWLDAEPIAASTYNPLGLVDWVSNGAVVDVPRSAINEGGTSYFCIAPGWICQTEAFFCAQDLADGTHGPAGALTSGGEGDSGNLRVPTVTAKYLLLDSTSGLTGWVPGVGAIDGSNAEYTLSGWDGTGVPQVKLNGLIIDAGDFDYSDTALTVTLRVAPQVGDSLTFRYQVGA